MKDKLNALLEKSYSPYSHFKVAAILITNDGKEYQGVNIENASFTPTICAERTAFANAIAHGTQRFDFKEIHIMSSGNSIISPCGVCRQTMIELAKPETKVICYDKNGKTRINTISELLPFSFTKEELVNYD